MAGTAQGVRAAPSREKDRDELRFLTCGSVDDGKSTLIGRLINDAAGLHCHPTVSNRRPVDRHDPRRGQPRHATGDWGLVRWRFPVALRAS